MYSTFSVRQDPRPSSTVAAGKICPRFSIHKASHENLIITTIFKYMNFNNFTLALYLLMSLLLYDACLMRSDLIMNK